MVILATSTYLHMLILEPILLAVFTKPRFRLFFCENIDKIMTLAPGLHILTWEPNPHFICKNKNTFKGTFFEALLLIC
jgi:hypothetical protein